MIPVLCHCTILNIFQDTVTDQLTESIANLSCADDMSDGEEEEPVTNNKPRQRVSTIPSLSSFSSARSGTMDVICYLSTFGLHL